MPDKKTNPFVIPQETIDEQQPVDSGLLARFEFPRRWLVMLILFVILALSAMVWMLFLRPIPTGQPSVKLWFDISQSVTSGSASDFSIIYENQDGRDLQDVSLEVVYPDGFHFIASEPESSDGLGQQFNIGQVRSGTSGRIKVSGIFLGSPQAVQLLRGKIYFQLKNINAQFSSTAQGNVSLMAPDFNLRISAPAQLVQGQKIEYAVSFQNISDQNFDRVQIRLSYPEGFRFGGADLQSNDNAIWEVGRMNIGDESGLNLYGILAGVPGDDKTLQVDVGYVDTNGIFVLQSRGFSSTRLLASPLVITNYAENTETLDEADRVNYRIEYENTGSLGMSNVKIVLHLDGNAIDYAGLSAKGGALVGKDVIWNPSGVSGLRLVQPQQRGSLDLSFFIKKNLVSGKISNPFVHSSIKISSNELPEPVGGEELTFKVRTKLVLQSTLEYDSGVWPPQSEQTTFVKVTFKLNNAFNQVSDAVLNAVLNTPPADFVDGSVTTTIAAEDFSYLPAAGRITWRAGTLSPYESKQISFKVKITPSIADKPFGLPIIKGMQASANDDFVESIVTSSDVADLATPQF